MLLTSPTQPKTIRATELRRKVTTDSCQIKYGTFIFYKHVHIQGVSFIVSLAGQLSRDVPAVTGCMG